MRIYLFKVSTRNTWLTCKIRSRLKIKTSEQSILRDFTPCLNVSVVDLEQVNICRDQKKWRRLFYIFRTTYGIEFLRNIFRKKPHPADSADKQLTHWNLISFTDELLAVLKCKIFLKFKIPLISPDRDILWPWNFPKYVSLTKEFDWWKHLLKPKKNGFWSVKHTSAR